MIWGVFMSKIRKNPFDRSFSSVPESYVETSSINTALINIESGPEADAYFITGIRGSGKTVTMKMLADKLVTDENLDFQFKRVPLLNTDSIIESLFNQLYNMFHRYRKDIKQISVSFPEVFSASVTFEDRGPIVYQQVILDMLRRLQRRNIHIVVTIDEVDGGRAIADFAQLFNLIKTERLPMIVLMTGLPEVINKIRNRKNLTFLYRANRIFTDSLDLSLMVDQYTKWLNCSFDLAVVLAKLTKGYPYAFQLFGYYLFQKMFILNNGISIQLNRTLVNTIVEKVKLDLFNNSYSKVYEELPRQERFYLEFVDGKTHLTDLARKMNWTLSQCSRYRDILLKKHLILSKSYGVVDFALPYFHEYINSLNNQSGWLDLLD